jgi:hypothetical protein
MLRALGVGLATVGGAGLGSAAGQAAASEAGSEPGRGGSRHGLDAVVELPGPQVTENLALDGDDLYFGVIDFSGGPGEVRRVDAADRGGTRADATLVATFPGGVGGVAVADGTVYAVVGDAVYTVPTEGGDPTEFATLPATTDAGAFANDVLYDAVGDRLFVTESNGGVVYEVPLSGPDAGTPATFADDSLLASSVPPDEDGLGANGVTRLPNGDLVVAVTRVGPSEAPASVGRLVRVPVTDDGGAGDVSVRAEGESLGGADGVDARGATVYVAANASGTVVRALPNGKTTTVVDDDSDLVFPSDVIADGPDLFVCDFAVFDPDSSAVYRTRP